MLYVDKRNAERPIEMFSQAGKVGPAFCTGVGKAMMAYLPDSELEKALDQQSYHRFTPQTLSSRQELGAEIIKIRKRGFAFDDEEHEPGIICVAVPILTSTDRMIGAISVTSTTLSSSLMQLESLVPEMREATKNIADTVELWRFPVERKSKEKVEE